MELPLWRNGTRRECEQDKMARWRRGAQLSAWLVPWTLQGIDLCQHRHPRGGHVGSAKLQVSSLTENFFDQCR